MIFWTDFAHRNHPHYMFNFIISSADLIRFDISQRSLSNLLKIVLTMEKPVLFIPPVLENLFSFLIVEQKSSSIILRLTDEPPEAAPEFEISSICRVDSFAKAAIFFDLRKSRFREL